MMPDTVDSSPSSAEARASYDDCGQDEGPAVESVPADSPSRGIALRVSKVIEETDDARSFVLDVPVEQRSNFAYAPGQFLTVHIPTEGDGGIARCYSLASSPHTDSELKFTVKRAVAGYGSNWMCDTIRGGETLHVLPPAGRFVPADLDRDMLLFAAGSGITPIISIVKSALVEGTGKIVVVYANRSSRSVIFARELQFLAEDHPDRLVVVHLLAELQGRFDVRQMASLVEPYSGFEAYLCGPQPFMAIVKDALKARGFAPEKVHSEEFLSLTGNPFAPAEVAVGESANSSRTSQLVVALDGEEHELQWPRNRTLVEVMLDKGLDVPYSCGEGECGSCACSLVAGDVEMDKAAALDEEDVASGYILGCRARPVTDTVRIEF
ncbi:ferredoxin--NADP reductase [Gordonia sp. LSe1-13]|uniref:Ferredoxin--NADP reductase n=1 Tax=Gordonia sesuvii TaxID=3116777 RepID=A0ABU7M9D5_9ACTN|nr:ferredoxin--NADP reductase [Gordonia sp. LSe1-13]